MQLLNAITGRKMQTIQERIKKSIERYSATSEGSWITIRGTHVQLDKDGIVVSGPDRLRGHMKAPEAPSWFHGKKQSPKDLASKDASPPEVEFKEASKPQKPKLKANLGEDIYKMLVAHQAAEKKKQDDIEADKSFNKADAAARKAPARDYTEDEEKHPWMKEWSLGAPPVKHTGLDAIKKQIKGGKRADGEFFSPEEMDDLHRTFLSTLRKAMGMSEPTESEHRSFRGNPSDIVDKFSKPREADIEEFEAKLAPKVKDTYSRIRDALSEALMPLTVYEPEPSRYTRMNTPQFRYSAAKATAEHAIDFVSMPRRAESVPQPVPKSRFELARERYARVNPGETHWITLHGDDEGGGTHVEVDGKGNITKGPAGLAEKGIKSLSDFGGGKSEKPVGHKITDAQRKKKQEYEAGPYQHEWFTHEGSDGQINLLAKRQLATGGDYFDRIKPDGTVQGAGNWPVGGQGAITPERAKQLEKSKRQKLGKNDPVPFSEPAVEGRAKKPHEMTREEMLESNPDLHNKIMEQFSSYGAGYDSSWKMYLEEAKRRGNTIPYDIAEKYFGDDPRYRMDKAANRMDGIGPKPTADSDLAKGLTSDRSFELPEANGEPTKEETGIGPNGSRVPLKEATEYWSKVEDWWKKEGDDANAPEWKRMLAYDERVQENPIGVKALSSKQLAKMISGDGGVREGFASVLKDNGWFASHVLMMKIPQDVRDEIVSHLSEKDFEKKTPPGTPRILEGYKNADKTEPMSIIGYKTMQGPPQSKATVMAAKTYSGIGHAVLNSDYVKTIMKMHPHATFHVPNSSRDPVVVRDGEEFIGILMQIDEGEEKWASKHARKWSGETEEDTKSRVDKQQKDAWTSYMSGEQKANYSRISRAKMQFKSHCQ